MEQDRVRDEAIAQTDFICGLISPNFFEAANDGSRLKFG
jgi:hypothetical protein